ncbi:MAG: DNA-directed RNA polymerase subunit omega [Lachnospiraceae bacterium]|nr:DNA-directed RNA polymerase subunit omega [Lachnospiraceae bacterium]
MLHPSYSDLMKIVNSEVEPGEAPVVNSRYSIVMATSKRARQLISGEDTLINTNKTKPLSMAVEELNQGKIKILTEDEARRAREAMAEPVIDLGEEPEGDNEKTEAKIDEVQEIKEDTTQGEAETGADE